MITAVVSSFWKSFNLFIANFGCCYSVVKRTNLLNNIVASFMVHFYGVYIIMNQCVAWRKALKIIWNVPSKYTED